MNEIRLNKLELRDFQRGTIDLTPNGEDLFIFGDNGTGKTRLFSAFTYLLFGKDSLNRADFSIKSLNSDGDVAEHGAQHTVEGILQINGESVTLKKVYSEKFVKTRGRADAEFAGHTTQHFIDGVPKSEKEYKEYIEQIAGDEQTFRLLSNPVAFPLLPWQKRRALLLEIFGDVSDADIIASDPSLTELPKILGKHKADDYKKIVAARQAELNKALGTAKHPGTIETRIDEVRRGLPDVTALNRPDLEEAVRLYESGINDAKLKLQGVNTGGDIATLAKKIAGLNADLWRLEDAHRSGSLTIINRLNQEISDIGVKIGADRRRIQATDGELKQKETRSQAIERDLSALRQKWVSVDGEIFKDTAAKTCPACGQPLPIERVQEVQEKALARFNNDKAERLGEIDQKGKDLKEQNARLFTEIITLRQELEKFNSTLPEQESKLKSLTDERDAEKGYSEDFSNLTHHVELLGEIGDLEAQIKGEREGKSQDIEKIKEKMATLQAGLDTAKEKLDRFARREQGEKRIEELKSEEKKLAAEMERLLSELYLIDLFTKTKVGMLNEKMTGQFEFVRWKLAEVQVNGAVNDQMCELTVDGVGYESGLNSGARIQAGCDIIRTFQRYYGLASVLWIDNRESVTELPKMDCQMINLVVSPIDKVLRIEIGTQKEKSKTDQSRNFRELGSGMG